MAFASTYTSLSLDRWAQIMQINPVHFSGAAGPDWMSIGDNAKNNIWYQYAWQWADAVSREDLGHAIADAEERIAEFLGYWPAPRWTSQELHRYPRHHRRGVYRYGGLNVRGNMVSVQAHKRKVISAGRRQVSDALVDVTVAYTDADGDGFTETATVTATVTTTDACEIKVYFADHDGAPEWEIRPPRTKSITGTTITFTFWVWQMIKPSLQQVFIGVNNPIAAVNIEDTTNFVDADDIEVRREYNDPTTVTAMFYWEPTPDSLSGTCTFCNGAGCERCQLTTQNGCIHIRDGVEGILVPTPATYDDDDAEWDCACFTVCRDPDQVQVWYYSGALSQGFLDGSSCEPMPHDLELAVAYLATTYLERPMCSGANLTSLARDMRADLQVSSGGVSYNISSELLDNPFGSRRGAIEAYRMIAHLRKGAIGGWAV